jgi:ABC-2 type transport system ATP-binding protein
MSRSHSRDDGVPALAALSTAPSVSQTASDSTNGDFNHHASDSVVVGLKRLRLRGRSGFQLRIDDLLIKPGDRIAIIGPNGAGKSTFIEVLLGLRKADEVDGTVLDLPVQQAFSKTTRRRLVGAKLQNTEVPGSIRVKELLGLHREVYGMFNLDIAERLGISALMEKPYGRLSLGERNRLKLCMALLHEPQLLFLDEPHIGLDFRYSEILGDILRTYFSDASKCVIIATHSPFDLGAANKVLWLRTGSVVSFSEISEFKTNNLGERRCEVTFVDRSARDDAIKLLRSVWTPVRLTTPSHVSFAAFGSKELDQQIISLMPRWSTLSYMIRPVTNSDVLALATENHLSLRPQ